MEKKACTFFGHRDCPETIKPKMREAVIDLIENHGVTMFYVGNQGNFDRLVRSVLKEVTTAYPGESDTPLFLLTCPLPRQEWMIFLTQCCQMEFEKIPKRFVIPWRNKWMIDRADYVLTYVTRPFGGAAQFSALAQSKGKIIYGIE